MITQMLNVAIIDSDKNASQFLGSIIQPLDCVRLVDEFSSLPNLKDIYTTRKINCVFIDIFSISVEDSLSYIKQSREIFDHIPICLYSKPEYLNNLRDLDEIPPGWRDRFSHYYKLIKTENSSELYSNAKSMIYASSSYLEFKLAKKELSEANKLVGSDRPHPDWMQISLAMERAVLAMESRSHVTSGDVLQQAPCLTQHYLQHKDLEHITSRLGVIENEIGSLKGLFSGLKQSQIIWMTSFSLILTFAIAMSAYVVDKEIAETARVLIENQKKVENQKE